MSLHFRYAHVRVGHSILSLGGRYVRPRPLVQVALIGPTGSRVENAILDTAADDTVFPERIAGRIGVDLSNAPVGTAEGVGRKALTVRFAEVTLRLADQHERREWRGWVGFTAAPMSHSMLGFAGVLQFFTAAFHGDREEVELTVNSLYRGT